MALARLRPRAARATPRRVRVRHQLPRNCCTAGVQLDAQTAAPLARPTWPTAPARPSQGEAGHARSSSSCFGRGDLAAGAGLAARPPASEAGAPEWQSSPCTPRLQRAASDALGDASGLACAPCAALADKPADQPAAGAGDGGVIVPHAQAAALGAAGVVNGCECSCRAGTRPCRDAAGRAACACHSQGEWGLVTRRYRDAAEPPLLGLPCQAPPAAVQLAAALWAPAAAAAGLATNSVEEGRVALQCAAVAAPARPAQGARLCDSWPEAAMLAGAAAASARPEPPAAAEPAPAPAGSVAGGSRWADELPDDLLRGAPRRPRPVPSAHGGAMRACADASATYLALASATPTVRRPRLRDVRCGGRRAGPDAAGVPARGAAGVPRLGRGRRPPDEPPAAGAAAGRPPGCTLPAPARALP